MTREYKGKKKKIISVANVFWVNEKLDWFPK